MTKFSRDFGTKFKSATERLSESYLPVSKEKETSIEDLDAMQLEEKPVVKSTSFLYSQAISLLALKNGPTDYTFAAELFNGKIVRWS
eukprot:UN20021